MRNSHPIQTHTSIFTATFDGDSNNDIPGESYGEEIPVTIITHNSGGDERSITVKIGKHLFTVRMIEKILKDVKKHNKAVLAYNS